MILTIFKILEIDSNYFWLKLLNKCTIVYLEIRFNKKWYHIGTSQLICETNQLNGFYILRVFTEYIWKDFSHTSSSQVRRSFQAAYKACTCSITMHRERPTQKPSLLCMTCSLFIFCLSKPGWVTLIWDKYTDASTKYGSAMQLTSRWSYKSPL